MASNTLGVLGFLRAATRPALGTALFLLPEVLLAGPVYGTIVMNNVALANEPFEISCGGKVTSGVTAPDGSYRILVPQEGQCSFTLTRYKDRGASAIIFSNPNPSTYNFGLVSQSGGRYSLERR